MMTDARFLQALCRTHFMVLKLRAMVRAKDEKDLEHLVDDGVMRGHGQEIEITETVHAHTHVNVIMTAIAVIGIVELQNVVQNVKETMKGHTVGKGSMTVPVSEIEKETGTVKETRIPGIMMNVTGNGMQEESVLKSALYVNALRNEVLVKM